jgi:hypothetical protein
MKALPIHQALLAQIIIVQWKLLYRTNPTMLYTPQLTYMSLNTSPRLLAYKRNLAVKHAKAGYETDVGQQQMDPAPSMQCTHLPSLT